MPELLSLETLNTVLSTIFNLCLHLFNYLQQKWTQLNAQYQLTETLKRLPSVITDIQNKWTQLDTQYHLTVTTGYILQEFITAINNLFQNMFNMCLYLFNNFPSIADMQNKWTQLDTQYHLTVTTGYILQEVITAINSLFQYLINMCLYLFNNLPSIANMQNKWTQLDAQYHLERFISVVLVIVVLVVCIRVLWWLFRSIFGLLLLIIRFLFWFMSFIVKVFCYSVVCLVGFLKQCLWFEGKSTVKMMKAPGKPTVRISRGVFEGNPKKYFSDLRGR